MTQELKIAVRCDRLAGKAVRGQRVPAIKLIQPAALQPGGLRQFVIEKVCGGLNSVEKDGFGAHKLTTTRAQLHFQ